MKRKRNRNSQSNSSSIIGTNAETVTFVRDKSTIPQGRRQTNSETNRKLVSRGRDASQTIRPNRICQQIYWPLSCTAASMNSLPLAESTGGRLSIRCRYCEFDRCVPPKSRSIPRRLHPSTQMAPSTTLRPPPTTSRPPPSTLMPPSIAIQIGFRRMLKAMDWSNRSDSGSSKSSRGCARFTSVRSNTSIRSTPSANWFRRCSIIAPETPKPAKPDER